MAIAIPSTVLCHEIVSDQDDVRYLGGSWGLVTSPYRNDVLKAKITEY